MLIKHYFYGQKASLKTRIRLIPWRLSNINLIGEKGLPEFRCYLKSKNDGLGFELDTKESTGCLAQSPS